MLLLAAILLVVGVFSPVITLRKLLVVENTFSVATGVIGLLREGKYFLFLLIGAFSVVLPVVKLAILYRFLRVELESGSRLSKYVHWVHLYGKWSMLDVFVVAILVVSVKLGALINVEMRFGLYAFAGSVLITMLATAGTVKLADRAKPESMSEEPDL